MADPSYNYSVFDASPNEFVEFATHAPKGDDASSVFPTGGSRERREDRDEGSLEIRDRRDGIRLVYLTVLRDGGRCNGNVSRPLRRPGRELGLHLVRSRILECPTVLLVCHYSCPARLPPLLLFSSETEIARLARTH